MSTNNSIIDLYDQAMEAKTNGNIRKATKLFKRCHFAYQKADLSMFSQEVKRKGEDAYSQYRQFSYGLDEDEFDNIIYGV
jgi:hypothetical protein